jgi:hypothetical protein
VQAPPGELGNRRKPHTQIRPERLQLRRPALTGTINRRLGATGDNLAHRLAVQPGAPGDGRNAGALPMLIEDHDNLSQSGQPLPSIPEREASAALRWPTAPEGALGQPTWGIFNKKVASLLGIPLAPNGGEL